MYLLKLYLYICLFVFFFFFIHLLIYGLGMIPRFDSQTHNTILSSWYSSVTKTHDLEKRTKACVSPTVPGKLV